MVRIVCVSDTHGTHDRVALPPGDIFVFAGDLTARGTLPEVEAFDRWLGTLNARYRHKVVIAGNHDFAFQEQPAAARARLTNALYLEDESAEILGIKIHGSPWQPWFGGWAFNLRRGPEIAAAWAKIPADTGLLVTHGPPEGVLDRNSRGDPCGCRDLLDRVLEIRPQLHVFGHIHEAAGRLDTGGTAFVNASVPYGEGAVQVFEWDDSPAGG